MPKKIPTNVNPHRRKLSVPMVAARLGIATDKVRQWVRSGELRACNLATDPSSRPRFGIDVDDLAEFERKRQVCPDVGVPAIRIRRPPHKVKSYF